MKSKNSFFRNLMLTAAMGAALFAASGARAQDASQQAASATASNQNLSGPAAFVNTMAQKVVAFLADKSLSEQQKRANFRTLLFADFDMDTIGRFALGASWNSATPAQRASYMSAFKEMIAQVYSQRFESYNGQKFQIRGTHAEGNDTIVSSSIVPVGSPEVAVDWRVRNKGGHYKVVDVIVEGVSMAVTQRSDFASVIQSGGGNIDGLISHLQHPDANEAKIPGH